MFLVPDQLSQALSENLVEDLEMPGRRALVADDKEGIDAVGDGEGGVFKMQLMVDESMEHFASEENHPHHTNHRPAKPRHI